MFYGIFSQQSQLFTYKFSTNHPIFSGILSTDTYDTSFHMYT